VCVCATDKEREQERKSVCPIILLTVIDGFKGLADCESQRGIRNHSVVAWFQRVVVG